MKFIRLVLIALLLAGFAAPHDADAQIWKRAKKRAEERAKERTIKRAENEVKKKADEAVDKSVDKVIDGVEDAAVEAVSRKVENSMQAPEPVVLGPNAQGPLDAPYVQYRSVTTMDMGMLNAVAKLTGQNFGNVAETITTTTDWQRTDSEDQSTVIDLKGQRYLMFDHKNKTYWVMTFDEMTQMARDQMAKMKGTAPEKAEQAPDANADISFSFSADPTGKKDVVNNTPVEQVLMTMEATYNIENPEADQGQPANVRGTFHTLIVSWVTDKIGGLHTIRAFQERMAEEMGERMQESLGADASALGQDPRLMASMKEAGEKMKEMNKFAILTDTYFILVPEGQKLDVALAMNPPEGQDDMEGLAQMAEDMEANENGNLQTQTQRTIIKTTTQIGDLTLDGIDQDYDKIPEGYKLVNHMQ